MKTKMTLLMGLMFVLSACEQSQPPEIVQEKQTIGTTKSNAIETAQMVKRLNLIFQNSNPMQNSFMNEERLVLFEQAVVDDQGQFKFKTAYQLAYEQLRAGYSDKAAVSFEKILEHMLEHPKVYSDNPIRQIRSLLAISYMRLGEQANCVMLHGSESCLFPLSFNAIHQNQIGSQMAMKVLEEILKADPNDLVSRWIYNIAAQTLGKYPDSVPDDWLIPMSHFASDIELPKFHNKAITTDTNVIDLAGSGILEDFNGDGYLDIMASAWGGYSQLRLLINDTKGKFVDATEGAGLTGLVGGLNIIPADYDNDGDMDLMVLRGAWLVRQGRHPNSLLRNDGNGHFSDVTESSGMLSFHPTQVGAWGDFDNDGWLDLFIGNESRPNAQHMGELYHNNADGTFTNVAQQAGLATSGFVKGAVWGDYDNDGKIDLYVSRMAGKNLLYKNQSTKKSWSFIEVAKQAGVDEPVYSFPTWFWDYDNDGWLDIFVADFSPNAFASDKAQSFSEAQALQILSCYVGSCDQKATPRLYHNNTDGTFTNVTSQMKLNQPLLAMGANFGDIDNDGYLDMFIGTGAPDFRTIIPNRMFRNNKGLGFQDVTTTTAVGHLQKGHGISFADLDNDGDQDIYAVMGGAYSGDVFQNALFENPGHGNNWISLRLTGNKSNRSAIGARVTLTFKEHENNRQVHREVTSGSSFGANSLQLEIGLGKALIIDTIIIKWPSGISTEYKDVPVNQIIAIQENSKNYQKINLNQIQF